MIVFYFVLKCGAGDSVATVPCNEEMGINKHPLRSKTDAGSDEEGSEYSDSDSDISSFSNKFPDFTLSKKSAPPSYKLDNIKGNLVS